MSHPSNYSWGNHSNEGTNSKRQDAPVNFNNWNLVGGGYQASWQQPPQQQPVPMVQNPIPPPPQQSNWNNNSFQKAKTVSSQMDSWSQSQQAAEYMQNQIQPPQQLQGQVQCSNNPNQYQYCNVTNATNQAMFNTVHQMDQESAKISGATATDPWNWDWDEPSNNSSAAPFAANNNVPNPSGHWMVEDGMRDQSVSFNPVQNYFQQGSGYAEVKPQLEMNYDNVEQFRSDLDTHMTQPQSSLDLQHHNYQANDVKPSLNLDKSNEVLQNKSDLENERSTIENTNYSGIEGDFSFDVKTENSESYQGGGLSNVNELKTERLSPDCNKTLLTTQALREFCKEKCENGSVDFKSRSNTEGLTPQWSIESQMSQETASDDISPYRREGSQSDLSMWDSTPGHQHSNDLSQENNSNSSPKTSHPVKDSNSFKPIHLSQAHDLEIHNSKREDSSFIAEEMHNQQILSNLPPGPPPVALTTKAGDVSGNNPYSLNQKQDNRKSRRGKDNFQKPPNDNLSGNEYTNLVRQMDACSVSNDESNHQVKAGEPSAVDRTNPNQNRLDSDPRFGDRYTQDKEPMNQETIPDNEERPGAEDLLKTGVKSGNRLIPKKSKSTSRSNQAYPLGVDNQEVAPRPDRNQYLETGQLEESDQLENALESLPPPGLSRHVPGNNISSSQGNAADLSSPPPGLHRMVLGQFTENEAIQSADTDSRRINRSTPELQRMVPGQLTDEQGPLSIEDSSNALVSASRRSDVPPPGLRRMVPGESSSPETQNSIQMPVDLREQRVVTGVATDDIDVNAIPTGIASQSPTTTKRLPNQPANPEENRLQFQSERCETIGSDNVDNYNPNSSDLNSNKLSKRKENKEKDRHRGDISSDESDRESSRRHERDSDYYSKRERNRDREDSSGERYKDGRDRRLKGRDWDRRKEYREDKSRKRDYREDRRHKDYDYSDDDDDDDTNDYYSDKERRGVTRYKDGYDRFSRKDDRNRSARSDKSPKNGNEERVSSKSKRRSDRYSDRDLNSTRDRDRNRESYRDRDRDRDRGRDRDRERERDRGRKDRNRQSDYYRRRDDTDEYSQRSRPSSRNDSVQDYKHRSNISDYDVERGHSKRDMFFPPGYNYNPAYYTYYYQYYENLRRTNPAAYAEWFQKYYAHSQQGTFDGTFTEDRGSVHSGRSSANDENKDRLIKADASFAYGYLCCQSLSATDQIYPYHSHSSETNELDSGRRLDSSLQMESIQRLTPAKFTTAHVKGSLTPRGQLVKILAHYPLDGQPATLEIHENLSCFEDIRKELMDFPGPLIKGVTHKNNILRYCKQKIRDADANPDLFDKESYKLIWELLMLLIRQNGTVVGTDIAELLMCNRSTHVTRQQSSTGISNISDSANESNLSEEKITNQFRDYLIYGNTKEALEWAMKHGLWGHALFLASKMDQRTYASVMTRFANGLTMNDPLQTLYQLMSGRQPASVTCCADEKWGDWRPHLAMILSNSTARPDLDLKAVTTLGDTLGSKGNLHAAHFCYLMAQVEFGTFSHKSSKMVLIGSSHSLPFQQFASNEAIFATEIFEFACSLADSDFALHHLQAYKLLMAKRLTEVGLLQEAVHYVEVIATTIAKFPAQYSPYFIQEVHNLGNMLKYYDPVYTSSEGSNADPEWLLQLLNVLNDYQTGVLQHEGYGSVSNLTTYSENDGVQNLPLDPNYQEPISEPLSWQNQPTYYDQSQQPGQSSQQQQNQQWNDGSSLGYAQPNNNLNKAYPPMEQPLSATSSTESQNPPYWQNQNQWMPQSKGIPEGGDIQISNESNYLSGVGVESTDSSLNHSQYNYYDQGRKEPSAAVQEAPSPGTLTLPGRKQRTISQSSEDRKDVKTRSAKKETGKHNQSTGSWFGGIWNKLPFRPKNQMILPDDKNPSIVWDPDKNRWVNLNADEDDTMNPPPPPPKASDLSSDNIPKASSPPSNPIPSLDPGVVRNENTLQSDVPAPSLPPSGPNKYKMARGKSLRSNYVDVFNKGSVKSPSPAVAPSELFPSLNYSTQLPPNYFIPASVEGNENAPTDFLSVPSNQISGRSNENVESNQQVQHGTTQQQPNCMTQKNPG